ncbi:MAG TPA: cytochrome c [Myxococcales bacterium]|nr:cytochrome c [Myxococcales bacterium]HIK85054.1 cytochrome c [Myxococcales bacterium]
MTRPHRSTMSQAFSTSVLRTLFVMILIASFGQTTLARADSDENAPADVKYRQTLMSNIGSNMGAIGDILKNGLDLPGHIAVHASNMAKSAPLIGPAFKKNVPTEATDAKPEIWQDWAKFEMAIADYEKAARDLASAAETNDMKTMVPLVKALGKSCGGCHKSFRKPKEESFHRSSSDHE